MNPQRALVYLRDGLTADSPRRSPLTTLRLGVIPYGQINRVARDIGGVFKRRVGCNNGREGHRLHKYLHHADPIDVEPSGGNATHRVAGFLAAIEIDAIKR